MPITLVAEFHDQRFALDEGDATCGAEFEPAMDGRTTRHSCWSVSQRIREDRLAFTIFLRS
jgi:hypothetical protein